MVCLWKQSHGIACPTGGCDAAICHDAAHEEITPGPPTGIETSGVFSMTSMQRHCGATLELVNAHGDGCPRHLRSGC